MKTAILCIALAVVGCAAPPPPPLPEIDCSKIHIVDYPENFEQKLVAEIKSAAPDAAWPGAIADYRAMRRALVECQSEAAVTH